jgi:two-component system sensor histidine kinase MtrB
LSVEAVDLRSTVNSALGKVGHLADEAGVDAALVHAVITAE